MQIPHEVAVQQRSEDSSSAEDKYFCGMGVLSSEPKRCRVLVVDFVNMFV
jgi:hypothetical protein